MPAESAAASSPSVQICWPFLPMTIAVPVSWHIGSTLPAAILAFFKRSNATNLSLAEASGSSRIARSWARWPGRNRWAESIKAWRARSVRASSATLTMRRPSNAPSGHVIAGELAVRRVIRAEREELVIGGIAHASLRGAVLPHNRRFRTRVKRCYFLRNLSSVTISAACRGGVFGASSAGTFAGSAAGVARLCGREFELKPELDRGVRKARYCRKGDGQLLRPVLKAHGDRKFLVSDLEPPELMLEDDRHLFGILVQQVIGEHNTGNVGTKTNVKMVSAAQPLSGCARKRLAYHPAQGGLDHLGVIEKVLDHFLRFARWLGWIPRKQVRGFCCPVPLEPRVTLSFYPAKG